MTTPPINRQSQAKTNGDQLSTMPCAGCGGARKIVLPPIVFDCPTCSASIESPPSPVVFVSERGTPFTSAGFARMIERAATGAGLQLKAHPHILRQAFGYALANKGHDTRAIQGWPGHRSITSTAVYTALAPNRFKDFWRE